MFRFNQYNEKFIHGNSITLLENGEEFFPQLIRRIKHARKEIFLETFILEDDRVGKVLQKALVHAAKRGVWVSLTVDSYGSYFLPTEYIQSLTDAGVVFQIYDPQPRWFNFRPKLFRRLHRKLAVIDGHYAFVGGINFSHNHMTEHGEGAKQDYTAEITGPVVSQIRKLCKSYVRDADDSHLGYLIKQLQNPEPTGDTDIIFVSRDNKRNRSEIEKAYLLALHRAKKRIVIANAYFFPGYRIMRALRRAAKRGVDVQLILQGDPDIPMALHAARCLYDSLTNNGIKIYEYVKRPLHAKIAIIDDDWSTIGSSNLDPWSLSLNLEANVIIHERRFNRLLHKKMLSLIEDSELIKRSWVQKRTTIQQMQSVLTYHVLRHAPSLFGWFPDYKPHIREIKMQAKTDDSGSQDKALKSAYPESDNAKRVLPHEEDYEESAEEQEINTLRKV